MRSIFLICTLWIVHHSIIIAQELSHVQGEILIQFEEEVSILDFQRSYFSQKSDIQLSELTSIPVVVWKMSFDFAKYNEITLLKDLRSHPRIKYAQFNHLIEERIIPDDPQFDLQWQYLQALSPNGNADIDLDAEDAWDISTGGLTILGDTIVACIIDDGFDDGHEDFGDNLWFNHAEIPNNGIDDDGNGYIDDYEGWDTYNNNGTVYIDGSHGTPVTGIIGAEGNNGIGVTGVNWDIKLMIVRGGGNEANALQSYAYPYYFRKLYNETNGAQGAFVVVTNASWGTDLGNPEEAPIWCNFYNALGEEGILSCGATANNGVNIDEVGDLPTGCSSDFLISVTNINRNDEKENNAGYGPVSIDLGAFGNDTWTTNGNGGYFAFSGTSAACPHVAGTIALLYSAPCTSFAELAHQDPSLAAYFAKQYLLDGVDPNESLQGISVTGGRLNMNNAMQNLIANCSSCPVATNIEFSSSGLDGFDVSWVSAEEVQNMNLRYKSENDNDWTYVENVVSPYSLTDIENCAKYSIQLQSICGSMTNLFFGNYSYKSEGCCEFNSDDVLEIIDDDIETLIVIPEVLIASNYILEYRAILDEQWTQAYANGEGVVQINGLKACTRYKFRVQLECNNSGSEYFNFNDYISSCDDCSELEYCETPYADSQFEWIESVVFSQDTFVSGPGINGYQNLLGTKSYTFRQEEYVDLSLAPGYSAGPYDEIWKVWIDYDKDGVFNETGELVFESEGLSDTINTGQFKVPFNAALGYTRMRIIMCYDGPTISCGDNNLQYGEVEDYCVFIDEKSGIQTTRLLNIEMFPNPSSDQIKLKNIFDTGVLKIYSASGQLVFSRSVRGSGSYELSLKHLIDSGVYFVTYQTPNGSWSEKLIKI